MVRILGIRMPAELDDRYGFTGQIPEAERPVVFIGPFEHHSNELPWRESIADVVVIPEDRDGHIDVTRLEAELIRYADRPLKIGSFSAASNVTGIVTDTHAISDLLHRHGALSFWDFAAAAPYVEIEMYGRCTRHPKAYKDAVFLSPHKFVGGPGTPGVLVVRRDLLRNRVPTVPGGGTVDYVNAVDHHYLSDPAHREEGGTPAIVESIRAGLVFGLKQAVGTDVIRAHEESLPAPGRSGLAGQPVPSDPRQRRRRSPVDTVLCGASAGRPDTCTTTSWWRCSTTCSASSRAAVVRVPARTATGCSASTWNTRTGSSRRSSTAARASSRAGCGSASTTSSPRPPSTTSCEAVDLVATHGWLLLPEYRFDPTTGLWRHRAGVVEPPLRLSQLRYDADGRLRWPSRHERARSRRSSDYLAEARDLFAKLADQPPLRGAVGPPAGGCRRASRNCAGSTCRRSALPSLRSHGVKKVTLLGAKR